MVHSPVLQPDSEEETKLVACLNAFKKGGTHMALVRKAPVSETCAGHP